MNDLKTDLGAAVHHLLKDPSIIPRFRSQFQPHERNSESVARNLNAAFLIAMTGKRLSHPARGYLTSMAGDASWGSAARFYLDALDAIDEELAGPGLDEAASAARELSRYIDTSPDMAHAEALRMYWKLFFPEGAGLPEERQARLRELRQKRSVSITGPDRAPLTRPHEEVLFTSNILLTIPLADGTKDLGLDDGLEEVLSAAASQDQAFWYDHPIPVGVEADRNEAVYGLRALDRALRFEIDRGTLPSGCRMPVLMSVSTTHNGLQRLAREYLASELIKSGGVEHLQAYTAAEKDVLELVEAGLAAAAERYFPERDASLLAEVLGVDGEYGRHYSFLKAVSALWQVLVDGKVRATFKIDLDQVFPQEELVSETGRSVFEHLADPLWGAGGTDSGGKEVRLGMLAGALVNEADIGQGLFTPDVKWPEGAPTPDQWVFASAWPQALSTEAEMMARYGAEGPDGVDRCLQRVHVTGGTTGVMVRDLRKYRPFTPGWIGRAEDQAYLMSVLFPDTGPALRYVHASGLIMRHDKETFAAEAIKAARIGKMVGDCVRILTFTAYARALPWPVEEIKRAVDPFTGCFVSRLPVTVACLRMALTAAHMFASGSREGQRDGAELVRAGTSRLGEALKNLCDIEVVRNRLLREKMGWDLYYDILDELEKGLEEGDEFAEDVRDKVREIVGGWKT